MKHNILHILVIFIVFFSYQNSYAQNKRISLNQAINLAYQNNLSLKAGQLEYESAQLGSKSVISLPKTNLNVLLGQTNSKRFDENISLNQDIPNPAYIKAQREVHLQSANLKKQELEINKHWVAYSIKQNWYQWLYLNDLKKVLLQEDSLMDAFVKTASFKFKAGESKLLEKTSAEARKQQMLQSILQTDMLMELELKKIQQLIGNSDKIEPADQELGLLNIIEFLDSAATSQHPNVLYVKQQIALTDAEQNLAKKEKLPDFNVGYFIQSLAGPQEFNGNTIYFNSLPRFQGLSLGMSAPIFSLKAYKAKEQQIVIQRLAQEKQVENINWQLNNELEQATAEYLFWKQNISNYVQTLIPNSTSIIYNATKGYQAGEIDYVEYLQALQTGLETRKNYLDAVNNLNQSVLKIQYLLVK